MKHFEYFKISAAHLHNYNAFYDHGGIHRVTADVRVYGIVVHIICIGQQ